MLIIESVTDNATTSGSTTPVAAVAPCLLSAVVIAIQHSITNIRSIPTPFQKGFEFLNDYKPTNIALLAIYRSSVYVALMRLNELRFLILAALGREPLHGYALAEEINLLSGGHHTPRPGALYHAIDKLSEAHLVELDREETVDGRVRRYYRLTESGQATVTSEAERRSQAAAAALDRITQFNPAT